MADVILLLYLQIIHSSVATQSLKRIIAFFESQSYTNFHATVFAFANYKCRVAHTHSGWLIIQQRAVDSQSAMNKTIRPTISRQLSTKSFAVVQRERKRSRGKISRAQFERTQRWTDEVNSRKICRKKVNKRKWVLPVPRKFSHSSPCGGCSLRKLASTPAPVLLLHSPAAAAVAPLEHTFSFALIY